jgi:hypothetical protein
MTDIIGTPISTPPSLSTSIPLAVMVADLQEDVPPVDDVPTQAQYERAIRDAVSEFSRRCGLVKNSLLSVVSGTADYALPSDFMELIEIDSPYDPENGVMITTTGIIPFSELAPFEEEVTVRNGTLTIYPTPGYTMSRYYEYKAGWVLDANEAYPLTEDEARIVMIKAKGICFEKLANAGASSGFKYSVGSMSVDKSGVGEGYTKRLYELHGEFVKACERYNGVVMR